MPTVKVTGTRALMKLRQERIELDKREATARREAAYELGEIALDAGAENIGERDFRKLISMAVAIGPAKVMEMLGGAMEVVSIRTLKPVTAVQSTANGDDSHGHA